MYFPPLKVMIVVVNHKNAGQICRNVKETKCSQCVKKKKKEHVHFKRHSLGWTQISFFSLSLSRTEEGSALGKLWENSSTAAH